MTTLVMTGLTGIITMATSNISSTLNIHMKNTDTVMEKMMYLQVQTKSTTLYQSILIMEDGDSLSDATTDADVVMDMALDIGQSATELAADIMVSDIMAFLDITPLITAQEVSQPDDACLEGSATHLVDGTAGDLGHGVVMVISSDMVLSVVMLVMEAVVATTVTSTGCCLSLAVIPSAGDASQRLIKNKELKADKVLFTHL